MQAAPAVAPEQASAEIDDQGEEERHLGERRGIGPGNHTRLVQDQERGPSARMERAAQVVTWMRSTRPLSLSEKEAPTTSGAH